MVKMINGKQMTMEKNNHHLFTMKEIRQALIRIYGEPQIDSDHNRLHQEMRWAWKRMPKYMINEEKHKSIHLPYKYGIKPSEVLIDMRIKHIGENCECLKEYPSQK